MKKVLSHTGYALAFAALCSGSGLLSLPIINGISKTIYIRQGSVPAATGTSLQSLPRDYQRIAPGATASFNNGLLASDILWLHSGDQNNNLGNPTVFDLSSPIANDRHTGKLDRDSDLQKIIIAKTKLPSEPTPTTKLVIIGKHKHQNKPAVYYLTKSPGLTKNASGNTVPVPGIAYRDFGTTEWEMVDLLLYNLGVR